MKNRYEKKNIFKRNHRQTIEGIIDEIITTYHKNDTFR